MRAIAGLVRFDGTPVPRERIEGMVRRMGLDGEWDQVQIWAEGPAGLGHIRRIHAPEDRFEAQPVRSRDGTLALAADALLENRPELAGDLGLPPAEAAQTSDSALVLKAFERWGEACTARIEGRYAFVVWNARERRLFCATDAFSHRPLYYFRREGLFAFATTLRGLFALPGIPKRLNDGVLASFLLTQPAPFGETLYADVGVLKAAHHLWVDAKGTALSRYWEPDLERQVRFGSTGEYVAAFRHQLELSLEGGMRAERNIAIMVSGGLDSASLTVVAGKILAERGRRLQALHLLAGNAGAEPRQSRLRDADESPYVRILQKHCPHIDFHFRPRQMGEVSLDHWDEAFERNWVPTKGIVTSPAPDAAPQADLDLGDMLYGFGGNYVASLECRGNGYLPHLLLGLRWPRLWRELRGYRDFYGVRRKAMVKYDVLAPFFKPFLPQEPDPRLALIPCLNPDFARSGELKRRIQDSNPRFWRRRDFDIRRLCAWVMSDLMPQHVGATGSAISAKGRCEGYSPFMTRRINEFCLAVPTEQQICDGKDRLLLRRAMKGLLPDELAWRVTRGFPSVGLWEAGRRMRAILPAALEEMEKSSLVHAYLDLKEIRRRFSADGKDLPNWDAAKRLNDLFCAGWFLRWLDKNS